MTKRITVSLPDDVAARLEQERNASAYVTEALQARIDRETTAALLADHGFAITAEGKARARAELAEARERWTPQRRADARRAYGLPDQ